MELRELSLAVQKGSGKQSKQLVKDFRSSFIIKGKTK